MRKILVIDNYDSFTYNVVHYLEELGAKTIVVRNNKITIPEIKRKRPSAIVISPGPCTPNEAGISNEVINTFSGVLPILGICLGHQCIGQVFGGDVVRARRIVHGKTSSVYHTKKGVFKKLPVPFEATRYHSLIVKRKTLPKELVITAETKTGEIMGMQHKKHPTYGIQFHPESIKTTCGHDLLRNFLEIVERFHKKK